NLLEEEFKEVPLRREAELKEEPAARLEEEVKKVPAAHPEKREENLEEVQAWNQIAFKLESFDERLVKVESAISSLSKVRGHSAAAVELKGLQSSFAETRKQVNAIDKAISASPEKALEVSRLRDDM